MNFKVLEDDCAKDFIKEYKDDPFVEEWLLENNVKVYLLYDNDLLKSFALLTKLNKDPLKIHSKPYYLNYIYTIEEYRRCGNAYELLLYIKNFEEMSLLCSDDISQQLFKKADFVFNSYEPLYNSFPIYRFP